MRRVLLIGICAIASTAALCGPVIMQPPAPPRMKPIAVIVTAGPNCTTGLAGATVSVDDGTGPKVGTTNAGGYVGWAAVHDVPYSQVVVTADGFFPFSAVVNPIPASRNIPVCLLPRPPPITVRTGLVRWNGRSAFDDQGPFHPLCASLFWQVWGERSDPDRLERNLQALDNKVDCIRIFLEVDGPCPNGACWADRAIDPAWPDYVSIVGRAIDRAYRHGLRSNVTIVAGGTGRQQQALAGFEAVVPGREHKLLIAVVSNENTWPDNGGQDRLDAAKRLIALFPWLKISPYGEINPAIVEAQVRDGYATVATPHFDRDFGREGWRHVAQSYDAKNWTVPCSLDEPIGPEASVYQEFDPMRLAMTRALGIAMGCDIYVLHTGPGIRGGGIGDQPGGSHPWPRHANFYDLPNFTAIVDALRASVTMLPADLANWRKAGSHWPDNPLLSDMFLDEANADHGVWTSYAAYRGSDFVEFALGARQFVRYTARQSTTVDAYNPVTGGKVQTFTVSAGGSFTLPGPERGGLSGYIVVGRSQSSALSPMGFIR